MADRALAQLCCHLSADLAKQNSSFKCLSQNTWPIQCPCVLNGVTHNFIPRPDPALVFTPAKLLKNWHNKCFWILDIEDARLGLQIYVGHAQVKTDLKFSRSIGNQIRTGPSKTPSPDAAQTLVLTTLLSYANQLRQSCLVIHVEQENCVTYPSKAEKNRHNNGSHSPRCLGTSIPGLGIRGMSICQDIKKTNSMCTVWFVSGTPWTKLPRDLLGVLSVLCVPSV